MKIIIVFLALGTYVLLFKFASGTLKLQKLNILSFLFYNLLLFDFIGASLIFIGFQKHYLIAKMINPDNISKTYCILIYTILILPFVINVMNYCFYKNGIKRELNTFLSRTVILDYNSNRTYIFTMLLSSIALLSTVYTLVNIGYIPILNMFGSALDMNVASISNSRNFSGNQYIKNIGMSFLTPMLSYYIYILARLKKEYKWYILFGIMFVASIIAKTYDFSKGPLIYYFFYFYIIEVTLGNVKSIKKILPYIIGAIIFLLFIYAVVLKQGQNILTIYFGPVGRIIFTQVATLFLHMDAFPSIVPYLNGASFSSKFSFIFESASFERSGRVVMETYSKEGVAEGTAGVMNTLFVGEAYANFGIIGVIIAPIIFGVVISFFLFVILKLKKTPVSIIAYIQLMQIFMNIVQGGFVDIFYNVAILLVILIAMTLHYIPKMRWSTY